MTDLANIDLDAPTAEDLRKIDAAVEIQLFGSVVIQNGNNWWANSGSEYSWTVRRFSKDHRLISYVVQAMRSRLFSRRQKFLRELTALVQKDLGANVAWPDLFFYIKPLHVCVAALRAEGVLP